MKNIYYYLLFNKVFLNYQRKSTSGYAIQSVLLDGGGGILSLLQMIIDAFNNGKLKIISNNHNL